MINSLYGPEEGGRLIHRIGQAVAETVRENGGGTYGRISGDIFCMCVLSRGKIKGDEGAGETESIL